MKKTIKAIACSIAAILYMFYSLYKTYLSVKMHLGFDTYSSLNMLFAIISALVIWRFFKNKNGKYEFGQK